MAVVFALGDRFPLGLPLRRKALRHIERIGLVLPQAALGHKPEEVRVPAVPIEQDDLAEPVTADLIQHAFQQCQQEPGLQGDAPWKAARLIDLAKEPGREHHGRLPIGCQAGEPVGIEHVRSQGQMWAVPFQHAQRQQAHAGLLHGACQIIGGQLFPLHAGCSFC